MELRNIRALKEDAAQALRRGREPQKVVLYYAGITVLVAAVLTALNYWLSQQIDNTGGLSNLGTRSILSTAQAVLPMVQSAALMGLELGYLHAMMRICRGQYADHTDLKVGFQRFFPLLRLALLQGLVYTGIALLSYQIATSVYMLTPWAETLGELMLPLTESATVLDPTAILTEEFITQATPVMIPLFVICGILCCLLMLPVSYRMRMANYALLDDPQAGAFAALRASFKMTRRNCLRLFKLDLSFWWYFLLSTLVGMIAYGDVLLPLLGIQLPINETAAYFLFYALYLAALFAVAYFLQNPVQCTYVMAYESICEKPKDEGVVLGNIFDMQ